MGVIAGLIIKNLLKQNKLYIFSILTLLFNLLLKLFYKLTPLQTNLIKYASHNTLI